VKQRAAFIEDVQAYAGRGLTRPAMKFSDTAMWVGDENGRIQILECASSMDLGGNQYKWNART
jgi:hypothetical protein